MTQDIIFIHGLKLQTIIGCLPWEKEAPQTVIIDVDMVTDCLPAAKSDDIKHSVDYAQVTECIREYLNKKQHQLVETLAENLAQLLLKQFFIHQVTIKINKPAAIPDATAVGVVINRHR